MLEESAIVVKIDKGQVWVVGAQSSGCSGCVQKTGCTSNALASTLKKKPVPVDNELSLQIGDNVIVAIEEGELLRAAFSLYLLPLIALLVGAGLADSLIGDIAFADLWIALSAFASLAVAFLAMHTIQQRALLDYHARPVVIKKC
jgi:sigma-E factor negative regulatory protein RseC